VAYRVPTTGIRRIKAAEPNLYEIHILLLLDTSLVSFVCEKCIMTLEINTIAAEPHRSYNSG
jgi:hypothetical protein